ncbi:MAG: sensor histidine kinase [bacterium]
MIEKESTEFIIAIAFTTGIICLVIFVYAFQLLSSGKRLRKAQRLVDAAIEFTPAFMTIVFDEHDRVADLKVRDPASQGYFREAFAGKDKQDLSFLPLALRQTASPEADSMPGPENGKPTAPLKMPEGSILYIAWDMQKFMNETGKTEFHIARGYDITTELLQTQKKLQVLSATSLEAEERERKRIAEDLHDRIGEVLISSSRLIADLKKKNPAAEISRGLEELSQTIDNFTRGTRSLIFDLVPPVLYDVGFAAAVETLAGEFKRQHKLTIRVQDAWQDFQVNQEIAIFLYKAVREFILNAMKHGGADEIIVALTRSERTLTVTVEDNGSGFAPGANPATLSRDAGFGLFNVKNRAEYYAGGVDIAGSTELGGGQIKVWVSQP